MSVWDSPRWYVMQRRKGMQDVGRWIVISDGPFESHAEALMVAQTLADHLTSYEYTLVDVRWPSEIRAELQPSSEGEEPKEPSPTDR